MTSVIASDWSIVAWNKNVCRFHENIKTKIPFIRDYKQNIVFIFVIVF